MLRISLVNYYKVLHYRQGAIKVLLPGVSYPHAILAAAVSLLLLSGLLVYLNKVRNRKVLQLKQEEIDSRDVTLDHLSKENEWLLQELHHRVKNNLQIVTSLLHSQSVYLKDDAALNAIMQSQHRIQAMSLIHKRVYQTGALNTVFMPDYIQELVDYLMDSFKLTGIVSCHLKIDDIRLEMVNAVPVGLILNEILTNAFKFAFPYTEDDCITISFCIASADELCLEVKDNGRGLPEDFNLSRKTSFGMLLMTGLTEQLDGVFSIQNEKGTLIRMCFKDPTSFPA